MVENKTIKRRQFLKHAATAAGALALPSIIPASARGADGAIAPSNRIVMASIGTGNMGTGDLRDFLTFPEVQVVAVCDVDGERLARAKALVDEAYGASSCKAYGDFRELLARRDLDAVAIALPDHWHAIPAVMAARAGLDIFGQKPLARSIREGRAIADAVARYGRVWQTGSQQRSSQEFHHACELVRNGRIGKVLYAEVGLPAGFFRMDVIPPEPVPADLNWEMWLGPAQFAPYRRFSLVQPELRCHRHWRWFLEYSCGQISDWTGHHLDIAHWGLGLDTTGPVEIKATAEFAKDGLYTTPYFFDIQCKYRNGVTIRIADDTKVKNGATFFGEGGRWIHVNRARLQANPPEVLKERIGPGEIQLYKSNSHKGNFLECIRTRQPTIAPAEVGLRSISVGLLGEIAIMTGRTIRWDPEREEILGDPGASELLGRSYREPWGFAC